MSIDLALIQTGEDARRAALAALHILDTPAERDFDAVVALGQRLLGCPIALIALVDEDRLWFKARRGLAAGESRREHSFCERTVLLDDMLVVEDAAADPRFAANPFVLGPPFVRFYAGAPLRAAPAGEDGRRQPIGSLCLIDTAPRAFGPDEREMLTMLAGLVEGLLDARALAAATLRSAEEVRAAAGLVERKGSQLRQAERMAGIGSWRLDLASGAIDWSDQVYAIHELPPGERPPLEQALAFYPEADRARIERLVERALAHGEAYDFESELTTARGRLRRVRAMGEPELQDGRIVGVVGVFQDVTDRHLHETMLREVANTDSLTGLPNRRRFEARLDELTARAARDGTPFALLLIDLDGFKPINDALGHEAGDLVLRDVGERLRGAPFEHCFAARLGGDEFVLLVDRPRDCAALPELVRAVLGALRGHASAERMRLSWSASVGAARWESMGAQPLRDADLALYAAKRAQRGTGRVFGEADVLLVAAGAPPRLRIAS